MNPFLEQLYDESKDNQLSAREMLDFSDKIRRAVNEAEEEKGGKLSPEERREVSYEAVHGDNGETAAEFVENGAFSTDERREKMKEEIRRELEAQGVISPKENETKDSKNSSPKDEKRAASRTIRKLSEKISEGRKLTTKEREELQEAVEITHGTDRTFAISTYSDRRYFYFPKKEDADPSGDSK